MSRNQKLGILGAVVTAATGLAGAFAPDSIKPYAFVVCVLVAVVTSGFWLSVLLGRERPIRDVLSESKEKRDQLRRSKKTQELKKRNVEARQRLEADKTRYRRGDMAALKEHRRTFVEMEKTIQGQIALRNRETGSNLDYALSNVAGGAIRGGSQLLSSQVVTAESLLLSRFKYHGAKWGHHFTDKSKIPPSSLEELNAVVQTRLTEIAEALDDMGR